MGASDVEAQENGELHLIDTFLKDLFSAEVWPAIAELKILVAPTTQHTPMGPSTLWGGAPNFVPQYFPHLPPPTVPSESQQLVSVVTDVVGKLLQGNVTKEYRKEALKKLGVSKTAVSFLAPNESIFISHRRRRRRLLGGPMRSDRSSRPERGW